MSREGDSADLPTARQSPSVGGRPTETVLLAVWPNGRGMAFPLPDSGAVKIGRARECEVRLQEAGVSRQHALVRIGTRFSVEDLGSSNGTRMRGTTLPPHEARELRPGDSFEIGAVMITIQCRPLANAAGAESHKPGPTSEAMSQVLALAERVARGNISVLLLGETGVGKDVMARHVHLLSPRAARPFLRLNCAALSESLIESELFGHEKGAFTGAVAGKPGLLETADGGTVFLDEVGELSQATQVKLLRVLEQREFFRVGSVRAKKVDVRFLSATNRDLEAEAGQGTFRQDLFFRLAGAVLRVPPLRQRRSEILHFARQFLAETAQELAVPLPQIGDAAAAKLEDFPWPGNLRQLRNAMDRAVLLCPDGVLRPEHFALEGRTDAPAEAPLTDERERIIAALAQFGGNQTYAAKSLGISRNTLIARIAKYGLVRPRRT
jgi:two-component system, NtrC family, response regulator AtoC